MSQFSAKFRSFPLQLLLNWSNFVTNIFFKFIKTQICTKKNMKVWSVDFEMF